MMNKYEKLQSCSLCGHDKFDIPGVTGIRTPSYCRKCNHLDRSIINLEHEDLYSGVKTKWINDLLIIETERNEAANSIGYNAQAALMHIPVKETGKAIMIGEVPVWVYLVVFQMVYLRFQKIFHHDSNGKVTAVAMH